MTKLKVGIIPQIINSESENPYKDKYEFVKFYSKCLYAANAIPIGLLLNDNKVELSSLELCDAFLWTGGNRISKNLYEILFYAYQNKRPVLGICMGMQALCLFSVMTEEILNRGLNYNNLTNGKWQEIYKEMAQNNPTLTKLPEGNFHNNEITRTSYEQALYPVKFTKGSFLESVYGQTYDVLHMHSVQVVRTGCLLAPVAYSMDNVIEAVESQDESLFWVGVQFHPEVLKEDKLILSWVKKLTK